MAVNSRTAALALSLVALAGPALAQSGPDTMPDQSPARVGTAADREQKIRDLRDRRAQLNAELAQAEKELRKLLQVQAPGSPQVRTQEEERDALKEQIAEIDAQISDLATAYEKRFAPLRRPVNLELKNATLRQAAEALTKVSGTQVRIDPSVPEETRLTLDANSMPLGNVLEVIAAKTVLMIAPTEEGVLLKRWPSLTIDGANQVVTGPLAPWSDEWEVLPTAAQAPSDYQGGGVYGRNADRFGRGSSTAGPAAGAPAGRGAPYAGNYPAYPGGPNSGFRTAQPGPFSIAAVGDRLVVAERGVSAQGEVGVWLTVYRLEGVTLKRLSSTFHSSAGAPGSGMMPGGMGAGFPGVLPPATGEPATGELPGATPSVTNPLPKPQPGTAPRRR